MEFARRRIWSVLLGVVFAAFLLPVHLLHAGLHDHGHCHGPVNVAQLDVLADCLLCEVLLPVTDAFTVVTFLVAVVIMGIHSGPVIRMAPVRWVPVVADRGPPRSRY